MIKLPVLWTRITRVNIAGSFSGLTHLMKHRAPSKVNPSSHPVGKSGTKPEKIFRFINTELEQIDEQI